MRRNVWVTVSTAVVSLARIPTESYPIRTHNSPQQFLLCVRNSLATSIPVLFQATMSVFGCAFPNQSECCEQYVGRHRRPQRPWASYPRRSTRLASLTPLESQRDHDYEHVKNSNARCDSHKGPCHNNHRAGQRRAPNGSRESVNPDTQSGHCV